MTELNPLLTPCICRHPMDKSKEVFVQINRIAYGYQSWQLLRNHIFIEFSLKTKKRKPIRR